MSNAPKKEVLYIDVDDEITTLIDRLRSSPQKIVVLVLPKRATVLQSIVNMKLLKRAASEQKKNVVLVTNEQGLMPLAGAVGLHVAATPNSKPVIPAKPDGMADDESESDIDESDFDPKASSAVAVGALAGSKAAAGATGEVDDDTIQLDNEDAPAAASAAKGAKKAGAAGGKKTKGKSKAPKVPDINSFKKKLLIGGAALAALIVVWIFAFMVLPKATIAIKTDSEDVTKRLDVTFDTTADEVDADEDVVPSIVEQMEKTATESVAASGQRNDGQTASGSIQMTTRVCAPNLDRRPTNVPAGTGVSSGGKTYITQGSAVFPRQPDDFTGNCAVYKASSIDIKAQAPGAQYNTSNNTDFSVSGRSEVSASGSARGGSDNIIKTVTQADIDSLRQKLEAKTDNSVQDQLAAKLEDRNLFVIKDTFNTGNPEVNISAKVGDQVETVNGTQKITYSMVGVKKQDLESYIEKKVAADIDTNKQRVLNSGLDEATFKLQNQQNNSQQVQVSMNVTAMAGPKLDDEKIHKEIAGKKSGDVKEILQKYPGVTDVEVKLSPFWVSSVPKSASKVTITYEK